MRVVDVSDGDAFVPAEDEVFEVVAGTVLVFATDADGRRCPVIEIGAGQRGIGVREPAGLVFTTYPGTLVGLRALAETDDVDIVRTAWVHRLNEAARAERWATRVVAPNGEVLRCAPGEQVSSTTDAIPLADTSIHGWLRLTSGTARWCGVTGADVTATDPALPVTRGVWLTSGLRARIIDALPPADEREWSDTLVVAWRIAAACAVARMREEVEERTARLADSAGRATRVGEHAVHALAAAVDGTETDAADDASSDLAAALVVLRALGATVPDDIADRVWREVAAGAGVDDAVARACATRVRNVALVDNWWQEDGPALLARTTSGHPVALLSQRGRRVLLDPRSPDVRTPVSAAIAATLADRAVEFVTVLVPAPRRQRDLLALATAGSRRDGLFVLALTLGIGLAAFVTPVVLGSLTASLAGSMTSLTSATLIALLGVLVLVLVATTGWRYVRSLTMLRIRIRGLGATENAMWDRIVRLRATWHADRPLGERVTQATAVSVAALTVSDAAVLGVLDASAVLGSLVAVATTNTALLATVSALVVAQAVLGIVVGRAVAARAAERLRSGSVANGRLFETVRAVDRLRVFGASSRALQRWARAQAVVVRAERSFRRMSLAQSMLLALWPLVSIITVVAVVGTSGATFAEFVSAQAATLVAVAAVSTALVAANALLVARATLGSLDDALLAIPEGLGEQSAPGLLDGALGVKDLVFRYAADGPAVLAGVSLDVRAGESVAIVGSSGSGKTTLMRVILGLEDPTSGVITVDGRDLSSLDGSAVRRQIGCVLQSSNVLPGTVFDNVDMGRSLTREQVWRALEDAAVAEGIRAMALGLDTPIVDGGSTISGGQRQRILIARALAGQPRMLVLDEATSALDNLTQAAVVDTLDRLRLTRIVVAQRLSTIKRADRVIVLDQGVVVEEGTYDDLLARDGVFATLAARQLA